ncbi:MAG: triphosphoribosyl-dephospho-CoA synthase [Methyloceanibacter sp.]|nr:triphosphoribosyl-dephospho-CoA synthase [Methyloceanibacter sp.]
MSAALTSDAIATAFHDACLAELEALKPGNVHRYGDGHGMEVADFEKSAAAAAPAIGATGLSVGERVEAAAKATRGVVNHNTNLGILLLAAPLAQAALTASGAGLRQALSEVLASLTVEDARAAYRAIRLSEPGGIGTTPKHDVAENPDITLLAAMQASQGRDRIAWNYANDFVDIFELGLKWRAGSMARWGDIPWVTTYVYLGFLAHIPDTLIERKFGTHVASEVLDEARPIEASFSQSHSPSEMAGPLASFDASLKERGLNPGTSADLTVATLFAGALISG